MDLAQSELYEPVLWVHAIWDAASLPYQTPDFEKTSSILSEERLNQIHDALLQACGLLTREKYYKYILKAFGLEETRDFSKIPIVHDDAFGMRYLAERFVKDKNDFDFRTLEFWEARLEDCLDLLERMKEHGYFIYSFVPTEIRRLSSYILVVSTLGILLPLFILTLGSLLSPFRAILSGISFVGFASFFPFSLMVIYRILTSGKLSF
jgi:hypothetical protein